MNATKATAIGVGVLGGIATWLYLSIGTILIWAGFIAWASFFAAGGTAKTINLNIVSNVFGVVTAWVVALLVIVEPFPWLGGPVWAGILVCVSVMFYIMCSPIYLVSSVPAVTLGYAATFAYLLQTDGALTPTSLLSTGFDNALLVVSVSMIIGTAFAFASAEASRLLTKGE